MLRFGALVLGFALGFGWASEAENIVPLLKDPFVVQEIPGWQWLFFLGSEQVGSEPGYMAPIQFYAAFLAIGSLATGAIWAWALRTGSGPRDWGATFFVLIIGLALATFGIWLCNYWARSGEILGVVLGYQFLYGPLAFVGVVSVINVLLWKRISDSLFTLGTVVGVIGCGLLYYGLIYLDWWYGKTALAFAVILLLFGLIAVLGSFFSGDD